MSIMKTFVYTLLAFTLQMTRNCEGQAEASEEICSCNDYNKKLKELQDMIEGKFNTLFARMERNDECLLKSSSCAGLQNCNKCFVAILGTFSHDSAIAECKRQSGYVANLYSQLHMDAVMQYIREDLLDAETTALPFRVGLEFNTTTHKVTLRDGTDAPDKLKSYPGFPFLDDRRGDRTDMSLIVDRDPFNDRQYLMNIDVKYGINVICEIE